MSRSSRATIVFLVLLFGFIVIRSMSVAKVECEVCITFDGQNRCAKASSETREVAQQSATTAACATLAGGMTESIRCQHTTPDRVVCSGD